MNLSLLSIRRLLLICGVLCTHFATAQVTQQEFTALKLLYHSLGGPTELNGWNFTSASANDVNNSWEGLIVEGGHVTSINLRKADFSNPTLGSGLTPTIGDFPALKRLSLAYYNLRGSIPTEVGNLTNLEELRLEGVWLNGTIPASIGNLTKLKTLDLSGNQLTGTISGAFGNLTQLKHLDLSSNQLAGTIPTFIGHLTQLKSLFLSNNQLTGTIPAAIDNLNQLEHLSLLRNQLTGTIPPTIGNLNQLKHLDLSRNQLTGAIPPAIGNLTQLGYFDLSRNQFTGTISGAFGNLTQLGYFDLSDNQLTGNIPATIGNLTQLSRLHLFKNGLTGVIPDAIGNLVNLYSLNISDNQLMGFIPASIGNLTKLGWLNLSHNNFYGFIPDELGALVNLRFLNLSHNYLFGALPDAIGDLTSIKEIELQNNGITDLPNFSGNPTTFKVDSNSLYFDDILPNISKLSSYAPQANYILKVTRITLEEGHTLNIDGFVAGDGNVYRWYKDGTLVFSGQQFTKPNVTEQDAGDYVCKVTNPMAPDLTLESRTVWVKVNPARAPTLVSLTPANGSSLPDGNITFKIHFSEKIKVGSGEVLIKRASDHHIVQRYDAAALTTALQDSALTFSSINLASAAYYITMSSGIVTNLEEHPFAG
ncbi:MAG TPA: hypothetical protein DCS93_08775, partial [Microscillaceae bacterium]|nr:hypothetical protein [Microscillaceae bacterium]